MNENEEIKAEKKKKCFVITPIGEDGTAIRRHIDGIIRAAIRPALEDKYEVRAAHEFTTTGSINNQVIVEIYTADLVVANLTDLNPNVMYELAIRHALKKPVIMIMEKGGKGLPFDVNNERTIFYINDSQGVLDLREEIRKTEIALSATNISNPIYDALIGYTSDESLIKNIESNSKEDADVLKIILDKLNKLQYNIKAEESVDFDGCTKEFIISIKFNNSLKNSSIDKIEGEVAGILLEVLRRYRMENSIVPIRSMEGKGFELLIPSMDIFSESVTYKIRLEMKELLGQYVEQNNNIISGFTIKINYKEL